MEPWPGWCKPALYCKGGGGGNQKRFLLDGHHCHWQYVKSRMCLLYNWGHKIATYMYKCWELPVRTLACSSALFTTASSLSRSHSAVQLYCREGCRMAAIHCSHSVSSLSHEVRSHRKGSIRTTSGLLSIKVGQLSL